MKKYSDPYELQRDWPFMFRLDSTSYLNNRPNVSLNKKYNNVYQL